MRPVNSMRGGHCADNAALGVIGRVKHEVHPVPELAHGQETVTECRAHFFGLGEFPCAGVVTDSSRICHGDKIDEF